MRLFSVLRPVRQWTYSGIVPGLSWPKGASYQAKYSRFYARGVLWPRCSGGYSKIVDSKSPLEDFRLYWWWCQFDDAGID